MDEAHKVPVIITTTMKGDTIIAYKILETKNKKEFKKWHIVVTPTIDSLIFHGNSYIKTAQDSVLSIIFFFHFCIFFCEPAFFGSTKQI